MRSACSLLVCLLAASLTWAADIDITRITPEGSPPADSRVTRPKTLDDYFPFTPPATREAWERRRAELREQLLVATGLWPMPEKTPLNAVIHGKVDRDEYTVEKVFFASCPGHYVCGNLYRPKGKSGKQPGVLFAHGHWDQGRFFDGQKQYGDKYVQQELANGAEKTPEGARYLLQAPCAMLARMGCVVFAYDMVGYADSKAIPHRQGFTDVEAELRLQSFMGLQTWNSIRALDFLTSLPDVDGTRLGMTGASGGGTQTFMTAALDDRLTAAFPAVMVSTAMQGGCICENCTYLRQATGNIELAALFAPKPLGMSGANDWTKDILTRGLPDLKKLYALYGAEDQVMAKAFLQFGHNYNQVSREVMYGWFNRHLKLGYGDVVHEKPFMPIASQELSVYDPSHPLPSDSLDAAKLRASWTPAADRQLGQLKPHDEASLKEFRRVIGTAARVMLGGKPPQAKDVALYVIGDNAELGDGIVLTKYFLKNETGILLPAVGIASRQRSDKVVIWIHPAGKASLFRDGKLVPEARRIIEARGQILAVDVCMTGEFSSLKPAGVNNGYAGYTFGYNRTLLADRVRDILAAVVMARQGEAPDRVFLVGWEEAGPWVLAARALAANMVIRAAADCQQFKFENIKSVKNPMLLPGALKYGGLPALAALGAPGETFLHNHSGTGMGRWVRPTYELAGASASLRMERDKAAPATVIDWLVR